MGALIANIEPRFFTRFVKRLYITYTRFGAGKTNLNSQNLSLIPIKYSTIHLQISASGIFLVQKNSGYDAELLN